jgi:hypothetical protein
MRHQVRLILVCVALASGACAHTPRTLSNAHAAAIRDSVHQVLDLFRRYSATRQWDSLANLYAPDARFRWVENGVVQYRSAADIRRALAGLPPATRIESIYQDPEIIAIAPGVASLVTRFQTRIGDSASAFSFGGAITMTLVNTDAGWRILNGHTSSPIPR